MQIREATRSDLTDVESLCDASGLARWTAEMIAPKNGRVVLVAVVQGEVAGIAKTHFHSEPDGISPAGHYLGGLVVTPESRRRGIGSALTRARKGIDGQTVATRMHADVSQAKPAIGAVKSSGVKSPKVRKAEVPGETRFHVRGGEER